MDRLLKYCYYSILYTRFTASIVAVVVFDIICKHHGIPKRIIYGHDSIFLSNFWREFFQVSETSSKFSSACHTHNGGWYELGHYSRCYALDSPHKWVVKFLLWAKFYSNTSFSSGIQLIYFKLVYERPVPTLQFYFLNTTKV